MFKYVLVLVVATFVVPDADVEVTKDGVKSLSNLCPPAPKSTYKSDDPCLLNPLLDHTNPVGEILNISEPEVLLE